MNITTQLQQAASLILKSQNIVLMPHGKMDCDGMSASVGLYLLLQKLGKNPTAVCADPVPEVFSFLPSSEVFSVDMPNGSEKKNDFIVTVDTKEKGFKDLKYTVQDGKVNIILSSENSPLQESDFSFIGTSVRPDLIITLDSGDTKQLGSMYTDNLDLFESVPVINIDHHVSNTHFGDVNLVDFKSCSTTELVYKLIPLLSPEKILLDADISTLLLAGMLTDTGSFQHSNTTPQSLDVAADLITNGARHQEIVKHLFKTKSLATLRVWGRVLTKLQNDPIYRIVWSSVARTDLEETQAHSDETEGLIDELMATTPGTELVLLVKEREDNIISTSVRSSGPEVDSIEFTSKFGGGGHKQAAGFKIRERGGKSFDEIVADIIFEAKKFQANRLNITVPKRDLISLLENEKDNAEASFIPVAMPEKKHEASPSIPVFPDYSHLEPETPENNVIQEDLVQGIHISEIKNPIERIETIENALETQIHTDEKEENEMKVVKEAKELKEAKEIKQEIFKEEKQELVNTPPVNTVEKNEVQKMRVQNDDLYVNSENREKDIESNTLDNTYSRKTNEEIKNIQKEENSLKEISTTRSPSYEDSKNQDNPVKTFDENIMEEGEEIPIESFLSPEETEYLNAEEYKISEPEHEIEKDEGDYIDDFADFLSKADDHLYIPEDEASTVSYETKNRDKTKKKSKVAPFIPENNQNLSNNTAEFASISSDLNNEDEFLKSLASPKEFITESVKNIEEPIFDQTVSQNAQQQYTPAQQINQQEVQQFSQQNVQYSPQGDAQNFVPPIQNQQFDPLNQANPYSQNQAPFVPNTQQPQNFPPQPNTQVQQNQPDPFLQSLGQ